MINVTIGPHKHVVATGETFTCIACERVWTGLGGTPQDCGDPPVGDGPIIPAGEPATPPKPSPAAPRQSHVPPERNPTEPPRIELGPTVAFETVDDANNMRNPKFPDGNPKTKFGLQKIPLRYVPPSAVHGLAEAFEIGAVKYGPYNWRDETVSVSVYFEALLRHAFAYWDGQDLDPETGVDHRKHAMACLAILVDADSIDKLNDDRPPAGTSAALQQAYANARRVK